MDFLDLIKISSEEFYSYNQEKEIEELLNEEKEKEEKENDKYL